MAEIATSPPDTPVAETRTERHLRLLAMLADHAVELACHLQQAALAAPELPEKSRLARDFAFVDRAARQSIFGEARIARQAVRDERDDEKHDAERTARANAVRKTRVQADVERRIWEELEPHDAEAWTADLAERLDAAALDPGFADEDLDAHIDRLANDLGVTGERNRDYLPRALRRDLGRRYAAADAWDDDIDDEEEEEDTQAETFDSAPPPHTSTPTRPTAADVYEPDFGPPNAKPPPPPAPRPAEPEPQAQPPTPPPEPPPRPYIPPWELIPPHGRFPGGGSGW